MKTYVPIQASDLKRPYGIGRMLARVSMSKSVFRDMDDANLGETNRSAFIEFATRFLLAIMQTDLDEREAREIRFLLRKSLGNDGYEVVIENLKKIL